MHSHVALFAGLGGFMVAARRLGIHNVFANDIDKSAIATLKANFPTARVSSRDIRTLDAGQIGNLASGIDILTAGFPCQSFSQAGDNLGFEDDRGKLFFEIPRFVKECKRPPKVVLLENVAYLKIFDNGSRLRTVVNAMRKCGYWVNDNSISIVDSLTHTKSPQRRERLFIVCVHTSYFKKNHFEFPAPFSGKKLDLWDVINRDDPGPEECYLPAGNKYKIMIEEEAKKHGTDRLYQIRRVEARACTPNVCPTLTANMGGGGHNVPFLIDSQGIRRLTLDECLLLQGFREGELDFPPHLFEKDSYSMVGNAVSVDVAELLLKQIVETVLERHKSAKKERKYNDAEMEIS